MEKDKKRDPQLVSCSTAILPAVITALAGVFAAYLSYSAGVDAVRIPLRATQTAEARFGSSPPAPVPTLPANPGAAGIPVAVDSSRPWQPSGVTVSAGEALNVSVTGGGWTTRRERLPDELVAQLPDAQTYAPLQIWVYWQRESDGSGSTVLCEGEACPIPNFNRGVLVARVGNTVTGIGISCSFAATESGQLFLQANDDSLEGNAGVLAVTIHLNPSGTVSKSPQCGATFQR